MELPTARVCSVKRQELNFLVARENGAQMRREMYFARFGHVQHCTVP
jgi:hypothetical protein